jgi:hypothetical protein
MRVQRCAGRVRESGAPISTTLLDVIQSLDNYDEGDTIFAGRPWTLRSNAVVRGEDRLKAAIRGEMDYFLEIAIAREFLQGWIRTQSEIPTAEQICARIIQYAERDA